MTRSDVATLRNSNTLFLSSSMDGDLARNCFEHLPSERLDEFNLAFVAHDNTADSVIESWLQHAGAFPERFDVIDVGGMMRSTASQSDSMTIRPGVTVHTESPEDLTGLGMTLSDQLMDDTQTIVCFDSLTMLLQYVELETAYQFLHVLTGRIHAVGGTGFFHMDPKAHDTQTVDSMKSVFDDVVELD